MITLATMNLGTKHCDHDFIGLCVGYLMKSSHVTASYTFYRSGKMSLLLQRVSCCLFVHAQGMMEPRPDSKSHALSPTGKFCFRCRTLREGKGKEGHKASGKYPQNISLESNHCALSTAVTPAPAGPQGAW